MKQKKIIIIITTIILGIVGMFIISPTSNGTEDIKNTENVANIETNKDTDTEDSLDFFKAISGVKVEHLELIDNPVGAKTNLIVPKKAILNGVDYFLKDTNNKKMDNVKVDIGDGYISLSVDYKVTEKIATPIQVNVVPELNSNKDLVLKIKEVKLLDLKISDLLVNIALKNFITDWFPTDRDINIKFNKGSVIISKDNFKGICINNLKVETTGLSIDITINLKAILSTFN